MTDATIKALEAQTGGTELGAIGVMQGPTPVKIGKQTIVDQAGQEVVFAKDATLAETNTLIGTAGATTAPPNGAGIIGWLRGIYDRLVSGIAVVGEVEIKNDAGNPLPVSVGGTVAANVFAGGAAATPANPVPAQLSQGGVALAANNPVPAQLSVGNLAASPTNPIPVVDGASKVLTVVGTANTALTATIPAAPAGQFIHITGINISRANGATATTAGTAASAITTTNLGGLAFRYTAGVLGAGAVDNFINLMLASPIRADTSGAAATIVLPTPGGTSATAYWIVTVTYFYAV